MQPMMALGLKHEDIGKYANYVMEPKLDGWRLLIHAPGGSPVLALTRSGRDVMDRLPQAWLELVEDDLHKFWHYTNYEWLDCEFGYAHGYGYMDFNQTQRVMGSSAGEAQRKAVEYYHRYNNVDNPQSIENWRACPTAIVFDIPDAQGPLSFRRRELSPFENIWTSEAITVIPQMPEWDENYYNYIVVGCHGEGAMLKNPNSDYLPGMRRANTWYKVKKFDTIDMFVTGFDPGQGKYEGLIGAIVCQTTDGMEVRCSGMSDDQRIFMTARQDRIIRERWVLEVKYFGLTAGTPRHPQFLRWREDKQADQCHWAQGG